MNHQLHQNVTYTSNVLQLYENKKSIIDLKSLSQTHCFSLRVVTAIDHIGT